MQTSNKIDLIRQALNAAESSIKLARQLLAETEGGGGRGPTPATPTKNRPGTSGIFDGEQMMTESGEKHAVPANYASKSMLVVGDTLKLVEEAGERRFKQIEHVKRHRTLGVLAKKDGKWRAVTPEGSYKVLSEAIEHFGGDVGDEVNVHLPAGNLSVAFAAIESVKKKGSEEEVPLQAAPKDEGKNNTQNKGKEKSKKPERSSIDMPKPAPAKEEKIEVLPEKKIEAKETVAPKQASSEDELT